MYDVAVIGLGAMGAASAWQLASKGADIIAFDQFAPPHREGSSHGDTRIIRVAYFEHPLYVPLVRRAWLLWQELELATGISLLQRTGGLMIGELEATLVGGSLRSAEEHLVPHQVYTAQELGERFP